MINIDSRVNKIYEYLLEIVELSPEEIRVIKSAISSVHEISASDGPGLFSKLNNLISVSEDLAWVISVITSQQHEIRKSIKEIKDPDFVMLVRKGRPSTQAIESEIRFNHDDLVKMEENLEIITNIIDYLNHLELSIDRYIWLCRDKMKYLQ